MMSGHDALYAIVALLIRIIFRLNGGLTVIGRENIPADSGALIAANHVSYLDPPLIGAVMPRSATFLARKGLFNIPVLKWMIKSTAIPVDREKTRPSTIKEAVKKLKQNGLVIMFPEGRRSETGELLDARRGVGMIVDLSKVPIIPARITGAEKALPVGAKWLKRAKITIIFGKPIHYASLPVLDHKRPQHRHEMISNCIMNAIGDLDKESLLQ